MHQEQGHCVDRQLVQLEDKGAPQISACPPLVGPQKDDPRALEKGDRWAILYGSELPTNERYARDRQVNSLVPSASASQVSV